MKLIKKIRDWVSLLVGKTKIWIKPWIGPKIVYIFFRPYQVNRFTDNKFDLILSKIDTNQINNVLDIGCNYGQISNRFSKIGKFCVGIDSLPCFSTDAYGENGPALGVISLNPRNIELIPSFDLILLLSVHHQWIKQYGDDYAKKLVEKIISKTKKYFIIEFAAISEKYGHKSPLFTDNNEESVRKYAEGWLNNIKFSGEIQYIGRNKEKSDKEPFRYIYMIEKN